MSAEKFPSVARTARTNSPPTMSCSRQYSARQLRGISSILCCLKSAIDHPMRALVSATLARNPCSDSASSKPALPRYFLNLSPYAFALTRVLLLAPPFEEPKRACHVSSRQCLDRKLVRCSIAHDFGEGKLKDYAAFIRSEHCISNTQRA